MSSDVKLTLNIRTAEGLARFKRAVFEATDEVFKFDIKARAQELSPVSPTWPSIPESRGEPRIDEGTNRRSIDVEVTETPGGVKAELFTQSGHGGYLELGTSKMPARPYLTPAFDENVGKIAKETGKKL